MTIFPNAKINIGLQVLQKRTDGFHDIETVFYPVGLSDILEVFPSALNKTEFVNTGIILPGEPEDNLCLKAFRILEKDFDLPPVNIRLHKIIPAGSGLGGGSSDAVFMIKLLNDLFELNLKDDQLRNYASRLGSDCSFFINNKPCLGTGRGDQVKPLFLNLSDYHINIVHPGTAVITAEAYASITPFKPEVSLEQMVKRPLSEWRGTITNDFEKYVFNKYPLLAGVKEKMYQQGAIYASLTGSGSAIYGLFSETVYLKTIFPGMFCWTGNMK